MRAEIQIENKKRNLDTTVNDELQKKYEDKCKELNVKPTMLTRPKVFSVLGEIAKEMR